MRRFTATGKVSPSGLAVQHNAATGGQQHVDEQVEKGALARTVATQYPHAVSRVDRQAHAAQLGFRPKRLGQVL